MRPQHYVEISAWPRTVTGKLDRRALQDNVNAADWVRYADSAVKPQTKLEAAIAAIWSDVLDNADFGIDDDFFELGGHSLSALQLATRIQHVLERPCPLQAIFAAPTIRRLARYLDEGSGGSPNGMVLSLQGGGTRPPLYCICGIHLYKPLAVRMAPDVPVYGIFLPLEEELLKTSGFRTRITIEEMAKRYLTVIKAQRAVRTFSLVGVSFGAILAFEIAQQAKAERIEIPLVGLIDMPPTEFRRAIRHNHWKRRVRNLAEHMIEAARAMVGIQSSTESPTPGASDQHEIMIELRSRMYRAALKTYKTRPYNGTVVVIKSQKSLWEKAARSRSRPDGSAPQVAAALSGHIKVTVSSFVPQQSTSSHQRYGC
jgi:thioesterase domain-containing protein/acyl carrier protein